ncbi:rhamnogalacturonan acetylesterase [Bacteroides sp. 214]|uniref:rhamnogalacturonan acetylesterase n=1 Tax=Bacteroides sp. 214 TaxID=2302935 RepID=UPI002103AF5D|nr:rhamnogalacturonan acetylesterase [Bacteroides sp. 214]
MNPTAPVVFTIGDSTMRNGAGNGSNGQWGWGSFFHLFFDANRITVENFAVGGRSSRTFYSSHWNKVLAGIKKGDYLLVQFGHNDGGPLNTGRARASLRGTGNESQTVIMERHGGPEEVFTFGHYLRMYIRQAKARGANVIVLSLTPGNSWDGDKIIRSTETYNNWSEEVAREEGVPYINMNDLVARKYEAMGKEATKAYFADRVHTLFGGAIICGKVAAEAILQLTDCDLKNYIIPQNIERSYNENDIKR